jgi:hypothetical protein
MQSKLDTIAAVAFTIFMLVAILHTVTLAFDRVERATCYKWQEYERRYNLYETHPDTATRCLTLGVDVHEDY